MPRRLSTGLPLYPESLAGSLLAAREAVMAPLRPHLRASNFTEQQWRVLRVLADSDFLDARGIGENALLRGPTVTRILRELADRKLILRKTDAADGRRTIVSITEDGRSLLAHTAKRTRVLLDAYTEAFGAKRLEAFRREALALAETLAIFRPEE